MDTTVHKMIVEITNNNDVSQYFLVNIMICGQNHPVTNKHRQAQSLQADVRVAVGSAVVNLLAYLITVTHDHHTLKAYVRV